MFENTSIDIIVGVNIATCALSILSTLLHFLATRNYSEALRTYQDLLRSKRKPKKKPSAESSDELVVAGELDA